MPDRWFAWGAWLGALGVVFGAFGAHGLKSRVSADMLTVWETGSRYHLVHALALLATGWAATRWPGAWVTAAGWLFVLGILIFSGSLYALAISSVRALGAITPIGGLCLIAGWICLGMAVSRGSR